MTALAKLAAADKAAIKADPRWAGLISAMGATAGYVGQEFEPTLELILDAGRMVSHGGSTGKVSDDWFNEMNKKYGWSAMTKFLSKETGYGY